MDRPTGPPPNRSQIDAQDRPVDLVETETIDAEECEAFGRDVRVDRAVAADLGEVAHPAEQTVRDARRAARPSRDLGGATRVDRNTEDHRGTEHDRLELVVRVEVETGDETEPVAQRPGDHAGARRGADHREPGKREPDRARRGALPHDDVELEVLHRGIEDLLDGPTEAMDLVDEEHVALVELREDRGEVAGPLERGARGHVEVRAELVRDDARERGLAETGRPGEQEVVGRLPTAARRLEDDAEVLLQLGLPDELGERARPQADLEREVPRVGRGLEQLFTHGCVPRPGVATLRAAATQSRRRRRDLAPPRAPRQCCSRAR